MKKIILTLITVILTSITVNAMPYERARQKALFLADKMAYELNLTEEQYEAVYEINLDYLLGITTVDDLYGTYWTRRNLDLSYILFDWQYNAFMNATYFYRPLYWSAGYWHFGIYTRYPQRNYYYFGCPAFYNVYRGGHSWQNNGDRSWYKGRTFTRQPNGTHFGMKDGFSRGDYKNGFDRNVNNSRNMGGTRSVNSSTRNNREFNNTGVRQNNTRTTTTRSTDQFSPRISGGTRTQDFKTRNSTGMRESSTRTTVTAPKNNNNTRQNSSYSRSTTTSPSNKTFSTPSSTNRSSSFSRPSISGSRSFSAPSPSTNRSSSFSGSRTTNNSRNSGGRR